MKSSKRTSLIVVPLILAAAGYGGYKYFAAPKPYTFTFAQVSRGSVESAISATGTLAAVLSVPVGSRVSGNVLDMMADFNTPVRKGQLIATIDPDLYQTALTQAQAQLRSAKTSELSAEVAEKRADVDVRNGEANIVTQKQALLRSQSQLNEAKRKAELQKSLFEQGVGSKDAADTAAAAYEQAKLSVESAEIAVKTAEANLESTIGQREVTRTQKITAQAQIAQAENQVRTAELNLEYTRITAPVDGIVVARNMSPGQTVQASTTAPQLFEIAQDLTKMQLETNIDESDISRVKEGLEATFTVDAFPGQTFRGEIRQVRRAPVNVSNVVTYTVVIGVENPDLRLFPGMTANTRIVTERLENTLRIPSAALRFRPPDELLDPDAKQKAKGDKGKNNDKNEPKDEVKTSETKAPATTTTADARAKAGNEDKDGERRGKRGEFGKGGDGENGGGFAKGGGSFDPNQFKGPDGQFDREAFARAKGFDPAQFQGKGGGGFGGGGFGGGGFGGNGGGGRGKGGGRPGAGATQVQTVYIANAKKLVEPIRVRTGISDGTFVAILGNNLEEGQQLVTGVEGGAFATANKQQQNANPFGGGNQNKGGNFKGGFPF